MLQPNFQPDQLEAARNLLYHYGQPGGWEPGSFTTALIRAMEAADQGNRAKLLNAFPEFFPAITILGIEGSERLAEYVAQQEKQEATK